MGLLVGLLGVVSASDFRSAWRCYLAGIRTFRVAVYCPPYLQFNQGHHEEDDKAGVHNHGDLGHVHRDPGGEEGDRGGVVSDLFMYCRSVPISSSTGAAKAQVMKNAITPVEDGGWRMEDGG